MSLPPPAPTVYSPDTCAICLESLHLPSNDDEGPSYIIDDVKLHCGPPESRGRGHHFHWSCIVEWVKEGGDRSRCPLCRQNTLNQAGEFIVDVRNEGGFTGGFDLGETIDEEIFMDANPQEQHNQAFLSMMAFSNHEDAETMLNEHGADVNCTYPTGGQTAMHMAALNDDLEGVQFLLRHGARTDIRDEGGMTPLDMARSQGGQKVIDLLSRG
ncbi:ankyrin [Leucogyrophana mollusca]|uniref:Ankyrin n=1 Tax=Leucogyrophana mollusca TaxID=85980 RepID=A0ACB8B3R9_9AGAM|nr:ankyrin [Leucogyrophana mollusca]